MSCSAITVQCKNKTESDSTEDTEFLPNIYFKNLWSCDISDKTKETIWKYLQLILFSAVGKVDDEGQFGETLKLFEAINDGEFKDKLDESDKSSLEEKVSECEKWFDDHSNDIKDVYEEKQKELESVFMELMKKGSLDRGAMQIQPADVPNAFKLAVAAPGYNVEMVLRIEGSGALKVQLLASDESAWLLQ